MQEDSIGGGENGFSKTESNYQNGTRDSPSINNDLKYRIYSTIKRQKVTTNGTK